MEESRRALYLHRRHRLRLAVIAQSLRYTTAASAEENGPFLILLLSVWRFCGRVTHTIETIHQTRGY